MIYAVNTLRKLRFTLCLSITLTTILAGCAGTKHIQSREIVFTPNAKGVIKTMTFNVRTGTAFWDGFNSWGNRKQMVIDTIAKNSVDVVGLQEGLDYQVEQIRKGLPQYDAYMVGRNDGKTKGETCSILYRQDRFEKLDSGTFWFSEDPAKPGSKYWQAMFPRICSWVHLSDRVSKKSFYVYNVHLHHLSQSARAKSVRLLADRIAARKTPDPFMVMGDFNMTIDNPAMRYLQNADKQNIHPRMLNAWLAVNPDKTVGTTHNFLGYDWGPKIDHIAVSEDIRVLKANVDQYKMGGRFPSDHFPVVATLEL